MVATDRLAQLFVEVADTLVADFDLVEFLQNFTLRISEVAGYRAVGLMLADQRGGLQLMAASDERAEMVELYQVRSHQGPCEDCFRQGQPVVNTDLQTANWRWPEFAPRAVSAGFQSVHAFPLRLRDEVLGALNLFGDDAEDISPDDARAVQALADVAIIALLQERNFRHGEVLVEQLQSALNSRVVIEQAKGALSRVYDVSTDDAFTRLRSYARRRGLKIADVARAVIDDPSSVPSLTQP